jgi:hypothetical protein
VNSWTDQHQHAAGVAATTDATPHLQAIKGWQQRARAAAAEHRYHQNKQALADCPPPPDVQQALYTLFAIWAPDIHYLCRSALDAHTHNAAADEPGLELDDLLQEAWELFLRAMIPSDTKHEALGRLRARLAERVRSQLVLDDDPELRGPVPDTDYTAPGFDVPGLYDELREDDRLPKAAERLWDRAFPSKTVHHE